MEPTNESNEIRKKATSMIDRANMLASIHSEMYENHNKTNSILTLLSIFVSIFILSLSLAPTSLTKNIFGVDQEYYALAVALLSFFSICLSIALLQFTPGKYAAVNAKMVTKYTKAKFHIEKRLLQEKNLTIDDLEEIYQIYLSDEEYQLVPNKIFLKLKKKYLEYKVISEELKKNPFQEINSIRQNKMVGGELKQ